ncbi:alpha-amylase family glycosyl hydrolase [Paenibacillus turpanensis]|uniref:alpha-amylase family glycosyl hydrolase n=1 Tax=Paenibacillus turpanensis TaxID=2689078 RepID=UPI001407CED4|nr:alpha-amylase family glycosyl hydrolase [Paenibacillus turpanensis]
MGWKGRKSKKASVAFVMALMLIIQLAAGAAAPLTAQAAETADVFEDQPGGKTSWVIAGSFQDELGESADWKPDGTVTKMKHLVGDFYAYSAVFPAGSHEFKFTKNGGWDNSVGHEGNNFQLALSEPAKVNFYVNEEKGLFRTSVAGIAGLPQYIPAVPAETWPRLVGSIQTVFGEAEWSPGQAKQMFVDYYFDNTVYKLQRTIPGGQYAMKVILGNEWSTYPDFGSDGGDVKLTVLDPSEITFTFRMDEATKTLVHDYVASDSSFDGDVKGDQLVFDSRSVTYKKPFGAIAEATQDVTLRIAALKGDVELAKVELTNAEGIASSFEMKRATTVGDKDFFEVTIPKETFQGIGIWGYKFILVDGPTKLEYGDNAMRGGSGAVSAEGALPYELTVYDAGFTTPDWMKNSIVYQIFPDRFFDGSKDNNRAKMVDGYRGDRDESNTPGTEINAIPLQYFDGGVASDPAAEQVWGSWGDAPENPDRITEENKPYYPDARSDGYWTNEFYGGDIQGIEQKLDYLKSLGVSAIYLNPVAWAASNHKYDATDYKHLDPMFGQPVYHVPGDPSSGLNYDATRKASDQVFINFAKAAKAKGIRLITDGVFNHVGDDSIYFDRYEKYPEIGAYEYWAKVWDLVNASGGTVSQADAEQQVIDEFTAKLNPATGMNYKYPEDFEFTNWFTVVNEKTDDRDKRYKIYKYDAWWGYDSLPAMDAMEPAPGDSDALEGLHEWNSVSYRNHVIGKSLTGLSEAEAQAQMQHTASQRWEWMGAQGWRLDVAPDVSNGTWAKFREAVKSTAGQTNANGDIIEEPIILGEEWGVATKYLLGDQFDSVMNYRFRNALQSFLLGGKAQDFHQALEAIREDYPEEAWQVMLNLVGSHDTTRSITKLEHPEWEEEHLIIAPEATDLGIKKQMLTAIFQMGYPGAPTVYYGDEVGVTGTKDPDSRRGFPWERVSETNGQYTGVGKTAELFATYQKAAEIRNHNEVFRTGSIKGVYAQDNVIVYARKNDTKAGIVAINNSDAPVTVQANVSGYLPEGMVVTDQLKSSAQSTVTGGLLELTIPAYGGLMMVSEGNMVHVPEVTGLAASAGNGSVSLSWDAVTGADSYYVYRAAIEGGMLVKVGTAAGTSYTDANVTNGLKYYYTVTAVQGTGESQTTEMVSATPFYPIAAVGEPVLEGSDSVTIGVGNKTGRISVTAYVYGLTDQGTYTGAAAPGLDGKLVYYNADVSVTDRVYSETKLRYSTDNGTGKTYWAQFEPTTTGTYEYYAAFSTNNGESYVKSVAGAVYASAGSDTTPPAAPLLASIPVESNRVELNWTSEGSDIAGFEIYRKKSTEAGFKKVADLTASTTKYVDFAVSNDTGYDYQIAAYDQGYNRAWSAVQSVTPRLVMVDVTLRLHLPDYTPSTDDIYIAGSLNGWTANGGKLNVPSGATDRSVVEYSFKMMAGKAIEYKYTRGTWETEAFTSHKRLANDTEDHGNWAYSSTNTNMSLTIANQGGNRMVVNDYVLRWVDMPMMVSLPRKSYGEDIVYETAEDSFDLKANVPYGVAFTINDQPLPQGAMDAYGNVELRGIPLQAGVNSFKLHIEPTAETLALPWYEDKGRAGQATETITMTITRTSGGQTPGDGGDNGGGGSPGDGDPDHGGGDSDDDSNSDDDGASQSPSASSGGVGSTPANGSSSELKALTVSAEQLGAMVSNGALRVELNDAQRLVLTGSSSRWGAQPLEANGNGVTIILPSEVMAEAAKLAGNSEDVQLELTMRRADQAEADQLMARAKSSNKAKIRAASRVIDLALTVKDGDGNVKSMTTFTPPVMITLHADSEVNPELAGVYFIGKDGALEYVRSTETEDGVFTAKVSHFSSYAVLEYDQQFSDVPSTHWSHRAVKVMAAKHVVRGVSDTAFQPEQQVTRAQFAAMLVRTLGLKSSTQTKKVFADVASSDWFAADVAAAYEAGLIRGRTDTSFAPNENITREELAVLIVRAAEFAEAKGTDAPIPVELYADADEISAWAGEAVTKAADQGLMKGKNEGRFDPKGSATRAESAQLLYNWVSLAK